MWGMNNLAGKRGGTAAAAPPVHRRFDHKYHDSNCDHRLLQSINHRTRRFELGPVWRQGAGGGDAATNAHLLPEERFVADFDICINSRPSETLSAAALFE